jgi:acetyl esterase/lipase
MKLKLKSVLLSVLFLFTYLFVIVSSTIGQINSQQSRSSLQQVADVPKSVRVTDNIAYRSGESKSWRLDLAIPENFGNKPFPAIVIIHGGGWSAGSKQDWVYRTMLLDYAFKGYVTLSVEYRLTKEAPFPAGIEDVKCAVRWLKAHAKEYNVDPDRIGVFGHSAGAHLAAMVGMSSSNKSLEGDGGWNSFSSSVRSVVAASTPTQTRRTNMNNKEWWPINYISADLLPMLVIQGTADNIVPVAQTDVFVDSLKKAGAKDLTYIRIEGGNHGVAYEFNLDVTKPVMEAFFERTLKK